MTIEVEQYDCKKEGHEEAVSLCCGSPEHPDVSGMCGGCNEMTGWECSNCEEEMDSEVYGIYDIPHIVDTKHI